jgi:hypothetical protein
MKLTLRLLVFLGLLCGILENSAHAQGAAQSKDYWVSYLPSIDNSAPIWLLAATNVNGTRVKITYMDDGSVDEFTINRFDPKEYRVRMNTVAANPYLMAKPTVPEVVQRRAIHISASNPISLQGFTDADNNVGLFLILPTNNLGQKYTISAFYDQHSRMSEGGGFGGWEPAAFPRSAGGFIIVGIEKETRVRIKVTGPTRGGRKSGDQWDIMLNRGETYWVQGAGESEEDDLSRSTVNSNKPVAVFAGCEIARTYDAMVLANHFDYNDYQVEQMIPQEIWGTEYVSAPFTNKRGWTQDDLWGDYYRVYASEPTELFMNGSSRGISDYWEFHLQTIPLVFTAEKPIMVVQNDYYVDWHGINPKNPRNANTEMVLVPRHNWRRNATFTVPTGYAQTYFHVVAHKDSIDKITARFEGSSTPVPVTSLKDSKSPTWNRDEYRILTLVLNKTGQVILEGPCDFAVYNYGTRDNDAIKATYGYASAAAASFGSISKATPPKMVMDSTCTEFNLKFYNTHADARGIGDIFLLKDPDGLLYKKKDGKGYESYNVTIDIKEFGLGADTVFATVKVFDPLKDAFAAVYVTNRAGKDTVYTFTYHGVHVAVEPKLQEMVNVLVFDKECKKFTFKNTGSGSVRIDGLQLEKLKVGSPFTVTANLPVTLKPNETFEITACFSPQDTGVWHDDTIQIVTACFTADIAPVRGIGKVPIIFADDEDYKVVTVGQSKCEDIEISNLSTEKELVLTKDILKGDDEFHIDPSELARFPITLAPKGQPGDKTKIRICYTPLNEGADTAFVIWGRDIPEPYADSNRKEWSRLIGSAQAAGVQVAGMTDTLICGGDQILLADLVNTGSGPASMQTVFIDGADAAEFTIEKVGNLTTGSWTGGFPVAAGERLDMRIRFTPSTSDPDPWRIHNAMIIAKQAGEIDTAYLSVDMRRPEVSAPALMDLGKIALGSTQAASFDIENNGNFDFIVKSFGFQTGGVYTLVSGIAVGTVIPQGGKITVNVLANPTDASTFTDQFLVEGEHCGSANIPFTIQATRFEVTAAGTDIPATWTCQQDESSVSFSNNSSADVRLRGVEMLRGDAQATQAAQIAFMPRNDYTVNGAGAVLTFNGGFTVVPAGQTVTFPVQFDASLVGNARVPVQFTYIDTAGIPQVIDRMITAIGKNFPVDLVITSNTYQAENDVEVIVPIELQQTNLFDAEVYGYEFDLTFNEDNFRVKDVEQGNGHLNVTWNETGRTQVDGVDYVTIHVRAHGDRMLNDENLLARMILQSRLTTENTTTIVPSNFRFLAQDGSVVCWTPKTELGEAYEYIPLCGDKAIAAYLRNGISFMQNSIIAPNPANSVTNFEFDLKADEVPMTIEIFDATGNFVTTVVKEKVMNAGKHSVAVDVTSLPSGTYFLRTSAGSSWSTSQTLNVSK